MSIQFINTGTSPNAGNGDSIRLAFTKINANFQSIAELIGTTATDFAEIAQDVVSGLFVHDNHDLITAEYNDSGDQIILTALNRFDQDLNTFDNVAFANITVSGSVLPETTLEQDLGSTSSQWRNLYLNGSSLSIDAGTILIDGSPLDIGAGNASITVSDTPPVGATTGTIWWDTTDGRAYIDYQDSWVDMSPPIDITFGSIDASIIPSQDVTYDLGSPDYQWRSLYVSSSTIYIGGTSLSLDAGNLVIDGNPITAGVGYTGSIGYTGSAGSIGDTGYTGSAGSIGDTGYTGSAGPGADQDLNTSNDVQFSNINITSTGTFDNISVTDTITVGQYQGYQNMSVIKEEPVPLTISLRNLHNDGASAFQLVDSYSGGLKLYHQNSTGGTVEYPAGGNYLYGESSTDALHIGRYSDLFLYANNTFTNYSSEVPAASIIAADNTINFNYEVHANNGIQFTNGTISTVGGGLTTRAYNGDFTITVDETSQPTNPQVSWVFDSYGGLTFPSGNKFYGDEIMTSDYSGDTVIHGSQHITGDLRVDGVFTFTGTATVISVSSATFFGDINGFGAFYAGVIGYTPLPVTVLQSTADYNDYVQNNFQNLNNGVTASTEWVATADNGNDSNCYIDMGIASSQWNGTQANSVGTAAEINDSWLYTQGDTGSSVGGNLIIGTIKDGKAIKFMVGSSGADSVVAQVESTGITLNTGSITFPDGSIQTSAISSTGTVVLQSLNVTNISATNILLNGQPITGERGYTGSVGYIGSRGLTGYTGSAGSAGTNGYTGSAGSAGTNGYTGSAGSAGSVGYTGSKGDTGSFSGSTSTQVFFTNATASTSTTTGGLVVTGGVGVGGTVTANKFVGDGSSLTNVTVNVAGNIVGTGTNVSLVAGSYSYTFDNTGIVTLPAGGGNEGAEIDFTKAPNSTLSGNSISLDNYVDKFRIFESGGTNRGVYIDLTQAAASVGTLLNNRVSATNLALDTSLTFDNLKIQIKTQNTGVWLFIGTVTGTASYQYSMTYQLPASISGTAGSMSATTTVAAVGSTAYAFNTIGCTLTTIVSDTTNSRMYRITWIVTTGVSPYGNFVTIERLI